jgi:hypothetical protein
MLHPENDRHWCHHFAAPPPGVFADSNWVKFGQRAGIDLRSLPYSALVLDKRPITPGPVPSGHQTGRIIGRPRVAKPYARLLGCDADGVALLQLPKRTAPQLVKKLDRPTAPRLLAWHKTGAEIDAVHTIGHSPAPVSSARSSFISINRFQA